MVMDPFPIKVPLSDLVGQDLVISNESSTDLSAIQDSMFDLVITDPPFGDNIQYAELSDFFYVWLRLFLKDLHPGIFAHEYTPKALEAVANTARHPQDADEFYQRILTDCWREAYR